MQNHNFAHYLVILGEEIYVVNKGNMYHMYLTIGGEDPNLQVGCNHVRADFAWRCNVLDNLVEGDISVLAYLVPKTVTMNHFTFFLFDGDTVFILLEIR